MKNFNNTNIDIVALCLSDLKELQTIGRKTFSDTFSDGNTFDDMEKYLDKKFSVEQLTLELENNESEFYFAKISDKVVGYLKLNSGAAQTENILNNAVEIE